MRRKFTLYPAIDLRNGQAVRLYQGDYGRETAYGDPVAIALRFQELGAEWIHLVDLDGAKAGVPIQRELIKEIARKLSIPVQAGGGIRNLDTLRDYLEGGVARVILGTAAVVDRPFLQEALERYGERIAVGLDARQGRAAIRGWLEESSLDAAELARELAQMGVRTFVYTDIAKDGTLQGPNIEKTVALAQAAGQPVIASGGVSSLEDLKRLARLADQGVAGAIVGKAIYAGAVDLRSALVELKREEG